MHNPRNLLTDVAGLKVGNAHDAHVMSGVTVVLPDTPCTAAIDVRGGGPGTRDSDALRLSGTVDQIHGLVLSGGSAFGLSAATGVQTVLRKRGIGFDVGGVAVPIVPQAILFDLLNGGDKDWGATPPYEHLAREACAAASENFEIGSVGAGFGATTADLRGGLGSASAQFDEQIWIAALVAVNAVGTVTIGTGGDFLAAPLEQNAEFGGRPPPKTWPNPLEPPQFKGGSGQNTTLGVVATNAHLSKRETHRLAVLAQTGLARAIFPVHAPLDGDVVYALATGRDTRTNPWDPMRLTALGAMGASAMARSVARAVFHASPAPAGWAGPQAWQDVFGSRT